MCASGMYGDLIDRRCEPNDKLYKSFGTDKKYPVPAEYLYFVSHFMVVLKVKKASDKVGRIHGSFGT